MKAFTLTCCSIHRICTVDPPPPPTHPHTHTPLQQEEMKAFTLEKMLDSHSPSYLHS